MTDTKYVNLLDVIVREGGYTLPEGTDTWGIKSVNPDLKTKYGFQWPFPGGVADQSKNWNPANSNVCPLKVGDGVCTGLTWWGMASGNIPARTLLLTAHDSETAFTGIDKVRAPRIHVVALIDGERLIRKHGANADLKGAYLRLTDLQGAKLHGANLQFADLRLTDLQGAKLWGADLRDAKLRGANLWCANLEGANLREAKLAGADLWGANLREVNLREANLEDANLAGANLRDANLEDTNLWCANLRDANLVGANLRGANLEDTNLWCANLVGADLRFADLLRANLRRAIMPDGYVYDPELHDKKYGIKTCM